MHHDDDVTVPDDGGRVNLSDFERQMSRLRQRGLRTITHAEIADWLLNGAPSPGPAVAIDFDDNRLNVFENAYPVMRELGLRGTVFVITDLADGKRVFGKDDYPAMTWNHLAELRDAGWCIAPHTRRHLWLAGPQRAPRDEREAWDEMAISRQVVEDRLDVSAPYFAYPNGSCNGRVLEMAKQLFQTARLWHQSTQGPWPSNHADTDPHRLVGINVCGRLSAEAFEQIVGDDDETYVGTTKQ